ncbi:MAG: phosphodiesterase [Proteobacteria bacterium]|jgi:3',5'-cyclic AMP phosphodiesterase CpdA|nr:phosphodiesterase [Pseudomonadota bacterium]MBT5227606.1 phosphodiesterase [Pseudomonadota bacterium]MBT5817640.1 phosphodiesterase [Pseudomonadota bacterium]MBT6349766.1 phosphodiesterase [Pseudomonadota bacterium]
MKIIHVTDTHFIPAGQTLYGRDPATALERCIADINRNHPDAERCVITGDLTHWGEPEAFDHLKQHLDQLKVPLRLLVGNHDNRDIFRQRFGDHPCDENGFIQSVEDLPVGRFIYLDTNKPGHHEGWYCEQRMQWLEEQFAAAKGKDLYLFMHHPPFDIGIPALDRISLVQKGAFSEVVKPHRDQIRHLFFGHIHRPLSGSWLGIPISSLRAMNHQVQLDLTNAALKGNFEPPAYCVVLFRDDALIVHTHDFMDDSPKFDMACSPVQDWAVRKPHP